MIPSALPAHTDFQGALVRLRTQLPATPLFPAPDLTAIAGRPLWLKAECLQPTGSFKVRGVLNWLQTAGSEPLNAGLITVSAGNHALALAWGAQRYGIPVTVVMPRNASPLKVARTRALGADVILRDTIQQAVQHCSDLCQRHRLTLVHPYNDPRIMAGQGTIALELLAQNKGISQVLCPVGGGGLAGGLGLVLKALRPDIQLIGVEPAGAATLTHAWQQGRDDAALSGVNTVADSLAPVNVGHLTYAATRQTLDQLITVSEASILRATGCFLTRGHLYTETGAAVTLAALMEGQVPAACGETAVIVTGGNMDLGQVATLAAAGD